MPKNPPVQTKPAVQKLTVSRDEAAAMLGVDIQTIDRAITDGKLRRSKLGRRVVIRTADIERMLDAQAVHS
jgi:excisionase family DNA binding protein